MAHDDGTYHEVERIRELDQLAGEGGPWRGKTIFRVFRLGHGRSVAVHWLMGYSVPRRKWCIAITFCHNGIRPHPRQTGGQIRKLRQHEWLRCKSRGSRAVSAIELVLQRKKRALADVKSRITRDRRHVRRSDQRMFLVGIEPGQIAVGLAVNHQISILRRIVNRLSDPSHARLVGHDSFTADLAGNIDDTRGISIRVIDGVITG